MEQKKIQISANIISALFGSFDSNIKKIENEYNVTIINRGDDIDVIGESKDIEKAINVINSLIKLIESGEEIDDQKINYTITEVNNNHTDELDKLKNDVICMTINGRALKPKTLGQKYYVDSIRNNTVVFGVGPAGTGKILFSYGYGYYSF